TIVKIVVAKNPKGPARITSRLEEVESHSGVDDDPIALEILLVEVLQIGWDVDGHVHGFWVVPHHVRRIVRLPGRFHEPENQSFIDVVLAALLRVHRSVVEALIRDTFFVLDPDAAESADKDERKRTTSRVIVRHSWSLL